MALRDWIFGFAPTQLKLADTGYGVSKVGLPKPPPLDVSLESLQRYSRRSELVYACIEKKAQAACDAEVIVETQTSGGDWQPVKNHPLVNLLNKPNPWDDGESFLRSWIASENFSDTFYAEIVRSAAGVPVGLYPLNPVFLTPQYFMDSTGWILSYYYYTTGSGAPVKLPVDDLLIRRRHGLGSIYSDVSAVQVALGSVDADAAMTDYVRAFFNNGGAPSGILMNKGRSLTDDEAKAMQQKWQQRYGRGGTNRGGVAVMDATQAEWIPVGSKLNELGDKYLNEQIETRICMAFGVPPILINALVGLEHITQNATAKAAMGDFWQHTMSPELKSIRKFLTWNLLPLFEGMDKVKAGKIRVNWDMSQVAAMQEDIDGVHSRIGEGYQNGIYMLNEARAAVGLDAVAPDIGDVFYQPPAPVHLAPDSTEPPPKEKPPKRLELMIGGQKVDDAGLKLKELETMLGNPECSCLELNKGVGECPSCKALLPDVLDADTLEKKTFNYDGLTLGREPTELEKTLDLKGMVADSESGKARMAQVILSIRGKLIEQAQSAAKDLSKDIHSLSLAPPEGAYNGVSKVVKQLFETGKKQVAEDLKRQGKSSGPSAFKDDTPNWIQRIVDRIMSKVVGEVQARAIAFLASRGLLDPNDENIVAELKAALEDQSTKAFEDIASQAANASIGAGRADELEARKDEIATYEYSAILDKNTCGPCEDADGQTATDMTDLPEAPNPECEGGANCRCFIIGVGNEENA